MREVFLFCLLLLSTNQAGVARSPAAREVSNAPPTIILGFVGGFVKHDDAVHTEIKFAARLRKEYPAGMVVETFDNHSGENAHQRILNLLDVDRDGNLTLEEKHAARIILYGHSWGASEIITLTRRLEKDGIPVLLTVQVDSVAKIGENDKVIPENVGQAVNFYQADGILRGEPEIQAANPGRTRILGNLKYSYRDIPYTCTDYPWYARLFMRAHTQIECDARIWNQVESLIRTTLNRAE